LDKSIGFDFLYSRGTLLTGTAPGTFARTSDPVFLNFATGNVTTRMRTLLQEGRGKVVSSPSIRTLNNQPATIASQITTYIFINQTIISIGTAVTNSNPVPLTANTSLSVAPRINDDNTITVFLNPTVASFVGTSRDSLGNEFPNLSVQSISVVARVKNGETIALGGMTDKNDNTTVSRVPLLSDLPIIGQFFRSTQRTKRNSDLLIFVTPRIVEEDEIGG
jgi:general secretion pathway protein D